jgi:hypothetical protein
MEADELAAVKTALEDFVAQFFDSLPRSDQRA